MNSLAWSEFLYRGVTDEQFGLVRVPVSWGDQ